MRAHVRMRGKRQLAISVNGVMVVRLTDILELCILGLESAGPAWSYHVHSG